jgi:AraC-like DNA-binding protein
MRAPANWTQRVGGLTAVPRVLRSLGAFPADVLAGVGLPPDALDDAENRLSYPAVAKLLADCAKATGCPHFGVLVGAECHLQELGPAGELARHSERLGSGLETMVVFIRLNNQAAVAYFTIVGGYGELGYAAFHPQVTEMAVAYDVAMAWAANEVRDMLGDPHWRPMEVLLPRAAPADIGPYRRHFGCPIRFDADRAAVRVPLCDLDRPLPQADAERKERLLEEAERLLGDQFLVRVYETLRTLLLQGSADSSLTAAHLAIHRRTLIRRLTQHGTSFQEILDQVRFDVARQMLRETGRSVTDIGAALGFSESSAFTHAFRRWSGSSPREWRSRPSGS